MAPETNVVSAVAVAAAQAEAWEIGLVQAAAPELSQEFPQKPRDRVIEELLSGLMEERHARQARNLNHWPEYGPRFLGRLAGQWKVDEAKRLKRIVVFLKDRRKSAVSLAFAVADNLADAEAAVSETDLDLLGGAVQEESYLLAVKRNALDLVRRRQFEQGMFVPLADAFQAVHEEREDSMEGMFCAERLDREPSTQCCDETDPLEVLIRREDQQDFVRLVELAMMDPRWRFCKRRKWAQPLLAHVPKRPAHSITK